MARPPCLPFPPSVLPPLPPPCPAPLPSPATTPLPSPLPCYDPVAATTTNAQNNTGQPILGSKSGNRVDLPRRERARSRNARSRYRRGLSVGKKFSGSRRNASCASQTCLPVLKSLVAFLPLKSGDASEVVAEKPELLWNSLFKEPKKVRLDNVLEFFEPCPCGPDEIPQVIVSSEAIDRETKRWEQTLVAYVFGKRPHYPALKACLESQWKLCGSFQMSSLPGGFFLLRFLDETDKERILSEGPWNFFGRPVVLKRWSQDLELRKESFNALPIWIRLPDLEFRLWDIESIGRIASVVGHPRFVDDPTADRERLSFARICVEITPGCSFPPKVRILIGNKWVEQVIHYEWKPQACRRCNSFEHFGYSCENAEPEKITAHGKGKEKAIDSHQMFQDGWIQVGHRDRTGKVAGREVLFSSKISNRGKGENQTGFNGQVGPSNPFEIFAQGESADIPEAGKTTPDSEFSAPHVGLEADNPDVSDSSDDKASESDEEHISVVFETPDKADFLSQEAGEIETSQREEGELGLETIMVETKTAKMPNFQDGPENAGISLEDEETLLEMEDPNWKVQETTEKADSSRGTVDGLGKAGGCGEMLFQVEANPTEFQRRRTIPVLVFQNDSGDCPNDDMGTLLPIRSPTNRISHPILNPHQNGSQPNQTEPSVDPVQPASHSSPLACPPLSTSQPASNLDQTQTHDQPLQLTSQPSTPTYQTQPSTNPKLTPNQCTPNPRQLSAPLCQTQHSSNPILVGEEACEDVDNILPPGFTPNHEDMESIRDLIKESAALVPSQFQKEFTDSVDMAEDGELLEFLKEKLQKADTNYVTHRDLRRLPRIRRRPAKFDGLSSPSGLKKGFLK